VEPVIKGYIRSLRPETALDLFRSMGQEGMGPPTTRISDEILLVGSNASLGFQANSHLAEWSAP
jgi:pentatricopeptide repeat protein